MEGKTAQVTIETVTIRFLDPMMQKFPGLGKIHANPDRVIFRIEPARDYFLDNSVVLGHSYRMEFWNARH